MATRDQNDFEDMLSNSQPGNYSQGNPTNRQVKIAQTSHPFLALSFSTPRAVLPFSNGQVNYKSTSPIQ